MVVLGWVVIVAAAAQAAAERAEAKADRALADHEAHRDR